MNNELNENERRLRALAMLVLQAKVVVTVDEIRDALTRCLDLVPSADVDLTRVARNIEVCLNVRLDGDGGILSDPEGHEDWLNAKRPQIEWRYWERYRHWLNFVKGMPVAVLDDLDDTTDGVLGRLESPDRKGEWDCRGMVVGHVQSGKTAHYTGLICKAVDAGYRLIIVLAGSDNGLRSQTQLRIDEGFLGFTMGYGTGDKFGSRVGVGTLPEFAGAGLSPISLTTADERGDFQIAKATGVGIIPGGGHPIVLVVKKHKDIMENLINWVGGIVGQDRNGIRKIADLPVLVIDDECDYASVNTKNTVYEFEKKGFAGEPTRINGLIRRLLHMFDQSNYIGYTATPFANIFIYHQPGKEQKVFGEDLFPRSFIYCLKRSSEYMGADQVFGLRESALQGISAKKGLPILRPFVDLDEFIPPDHKRDWKAPAGPIPKSLRKALLSFILVCAARRARGQGNDHNSMLLHLSRLQDVQTEVFDTIEREVNRIRRSIRLTMKGDGSSDLDQLKELWETDFMKTTAKFDNPSLGVLPWEVILEHLLPAADKITVKVINGRSEDALDYYNNKDHGLSVIAIGGAKLSRGLTLEGLSISYFQRTTKMYDTLMQMARWFGYRRGYADLCRLYTTTELIGWYRDIAMATEELYKQFDEMRAIGATPKEFGLRVAKSPENLLITARVKMRNSTSLKLSYAATNPSFRGLRSSDVPSSTEATRRLAQWVQSTSSGPSESERPNHVFTGLPVDGVLRFLKDFPPYPGVTSADPDLLSTYIEACNAVGELTYWTVAFVSLSDPNSEPLPFEGMEIRRPRRQATVDGGGIVGNRVVGTLWDPVHEGLGLTADELLHMEHAAKERNIEIPKPPRGSHYRLGRQPAHGLLVVYLLDPEGLNGENGESPADFAGFEFVPTFAMSFPFSGKAPAIDYVVNNQYWSKDDEEEDQ